MHSEDTNILELNHFQKSDKAPLYADPKCLIEKIDGCKNNPENSSTTEANDYIPSGFSKSTTILFIMYTELKTAWTSFSNP